MVGNFSLKTFCSRTTAQMEPQRIAQNEVKGFVSVDQCSFH